MKRWKQFFKGEKVDRTIHVIKSESSHENRSYIQSAYHRFKRFGSLETIRTGCVDCLFIQYRNAEDAVKLLKIGQIEIDHIEFRILSADSFHDQITGDCTHNGHIFTDHTNHLETVTKETSEYKFYDLNDDCLREIFRNISLVNFCSVANVCKRFNAIAMEIFPSKIKQKTFNLNDLIVNGDVTLVRLKCFLTMFGASVHTAHLDFDDIHFEYTPNAMNLALKMINSYCKNLQSLSIWFGNYENKINWMEIYSILPMLKYLKIEIDHFANTVDSLTDFISSCCLLEKLIIDARWGNFTLILPETTFPKLIKFKLSGCPNDINLDKFLKHNSQLEKIKCFSFDYCRFIGLNMPSIRTLSMHGGRTVDENVEDSKFLNENVKIKLDNLLTGGEDIGNICQLKNIRSISAEVWTPFGANHFISLARSQKNLKKLTITILDPKIKYPIDMIKPMLSYASQLIRIKIICRNGLRIRFNQKDFEEILNIVKHRNNFNNLNISFTNDFHWPRFKLSGKWRREKLIIFNDESNRLNVISHYVMPF